MTKVKDKCEEEFDKKEEENFHLSKEGHYRPIVQTWTNPLFNPNPPFIPFTSVSKLSLECRGEAETFARQEQRRGREVVKEVRYSVKSRNH